MEDTKLFNLLTILPSVLRIITLAQTRIPHGQEKLFLCQGLETRSTPTTPPVLPRQMGKASRPQATRDQPALSQ